MIQKSKKQMAKKKQVKTNAIRIVEQKKIPYQEHTYTFSEDDLGAKHVAEELNQNFQDVGSCGQ